VGDRQYEPICDGPAGEGGALAGTAGRTPGAEGVRAPDRRLTRFAPAAGALRAMQGHSGGHGAKDERAEALKEF